MPSRDCKGCSRVYLRQWHRKDWYSLHKGSKWGEWILSMCRNIWWEGEKKTELGSSQWCPVKGQEAMRANCNYKKVHLKLRKCFFFFFYDKSGWTLKQRAQRGYGVSISRDIINLAGRGPEQPALVHTAWARGLD